jgi:hypothetical protein
MTDSIKISKQAARDAVKYRAAKAQAERLGVSLELVDDPNYKEPIPPAIVVLQTELKVGRIYAAAKAKAKELGGEILVAEDEADYAKTCATLSQAGRPVLVHDGLEMKPWGTTT